MKDVSKENSIKLVFMFSGTGEVHEHNMIKTLIIIGFKINEVVFIDIKKFKVEKKKIIYNKNLTDEINPDLLLTLSKENINFETKSWSEYNDWINVGNNDKSLIFIFNPGYYYNEKLLNTLNILKKERNNEYMPNATELGYEKHFFLQNIYDSLIKKMEIIIIYTTIEGENCKIKSMKSDDAYKFNFFRPYKESLKMINKINKINKIYNSKNIAALYSNSYWIGLYCLIMNFNYTEFLEKYTKIPQNLDKEFYFTKFGFIPDYHTMCKFSASGFLIDFKQYFIPLFDEFNIMYQDYNIVNEKKIYKAKNIDCIEKS